MRLPPCRKIVCDGTTEPCSGAAWINLSQVELEKMRSSAYPKALPPSTATWSRYGQQRLQRNKCLLTCVRKSLHCLAPLAAMTEAAPWGGDVEEDRHPSFGCLGEAGNNGPVPIPPNRLPGGSSLYIAGKNPIPKSVVVKSGLRLLSPEAAIANLPATSFIRSEVSGDVLKWLWRRCLKA